MDVKALRRQLGLTQGELAKKLPVAQRSIQRWESRDAVPIPSLRARLRELVKESQRRQRMSDNGPAKRQLVAGAHEDTP